MSVINKHILVKSPKWSSHLDTLLTLAEEPIEIPSQRLSFDNVVHTELDKISCKQMGLVYLHILDYYSNN